MQRREHDCQHGRPEQRAEERPQDTSEGQRYREDEQQQGVVFKAAQAGMAFTFLWGIRQLGNLHCGKSAECVTAQAMRGVVFAWGAGCPRIVDGRAKPGHDEGQTGEITEKTKTRDYWMPACAGVTTPSKNEAQKRALAHRIGSGLVGLLGIGLVRAVGVAIAVAIAAIAAVTPAPALLAAAAVMLAIAFMALAVLRATTLAHLPAALPEIAATAAGADVSAALDAIELAAFVI